MCKLKNGKVVEKRLVDEVVAVLEMLKDDNSDISRHIIDEIYEKAHNNSYELIRKDVEDFLKKVEFINFFGDMFFDISDIIQSSINIVNGVYIIDNPLIGEHNSES